jgi:hypothetical protein
MCQPDAGQTPAAGLPPVGGRRQTEARHRHCVGGPRSGFIGTLSCGTGRSHVCALG